MSSIREQLLPRLDFCFNNKILITEIGKCMGKCDILSF